MNLELVIFFVENQHGRSYPERNMKSSFLLIQFTTLRQGLKQNKKREGGQRRVDFPLKKRLYDT